jgi:hypothetical protein
MLEMLQEQIENLRENINAADSDEEFAIYSEELENCLDTVRELEEG